MDHHPDNTMMNTSPETIRDRLEDALLTHQVPPSPELLDTLENLADEAAYPAAADMLAALDETLHAAGIELCFAEMKGPVKDKLKRFGLFARLGEETFFPTVGAAVSDYLVTHPVKWVDWEDGRP